MHAGPVALGLASRPSAGQTKPSVETPVETPVEKPVEVTGTAPPEEKDEMKVWIDQDLCTGDGLCEEIAPDVFTLLDDGLAYVKEGGKVFSDPGGPEGLANVPAGMEEATIESAEECPGECIFIEVD
jgi:ferredoxin